MVKYLTKEGLEKLKNELDRLENVDRREVIKRISHAASHGDLKENAGYHAAREDQAFIEGRIIDLRKIISQAKVIEGAKVNKVAIGSIVLLESGSGKDKYQVVEPEEADLAAGKISHKSPLGAALLGKKKGERVEFSTSQGSREYKIIDIE